METEYFGNGKPTNEYAPRAKITTKHKSTTGNNNNNNNSFLSAPSRKYCERFDKTTHKPMNKIVDYIPSCHRIGNKRNAAHFGFVTFKE